MRNPFAPPPRDFTVAPLAASDTARLSILHREDFLRPWTDGEFAALLEQDTVFGYAALETGRGRQGPVGFVLARLAAGEAEILTLAVARSHRRLGLGWMLMDAVLRELHTQRAQALFLEVDETNAAAVGLYRRLGFVEVGRRPAYYADTQGRKTAALVMRRDLR
ncbi:MAG: GNAT family N-acetyltransferase [Rhizobiaceae bacterium]|nr:GNAT family N-acetyltransferase [Rhizobiaceae bacterium]